MTFECFLDTQILIRSGRIPEEALMILVPEAYKNHPTLSIKYPEVLQEDIYTSSISL